jgi:hypothetical protein
MTAVRIFTFTLEAPTTVEAYWGFKEALEALNRYGDVHYSIKIVEPK